MFSGVLKSRQTVKVEPHQPSNNSRRSQPCTSSSCDHENEEIEGKKQDNSLGFTPPTGWREIWEARQAELLSDAEREVVEEESAQILEPLGFEQDYIAGYLAENGMESNDDECPLIRIRSGYVYDKRANIIRRRVMMDDFVEERYKREREERKRREAEDRKAEEEIARSETHADVEKQKGDENGKDEDGGWEMEDEELTSLLERDYGTSVGLAELATTALRMTYPRL